MDFNDLLNRYGYLIVLVIVAAAFYAFRAMRLRTQGNNWEALAARHGLTLERPGGEPRLTGSYRGRAVIVDSERRGPPRQSADFTWVQFDLQRSIAGKVEIYHYNQVYSAKEREQVRKLMYKDLLDTGELEFDSRYLVNTKSPEVAQSLFVSGGPIRDAVENLFAQTGIGTVYLEGASLKYEWGGRERDAQKIQRNFDLASDLADAIEKSK